MSATIANRLPFAPPSVPARSPLERAQLKLVKDILALDMPAYPSYPAPADHYAFPDVLREAAAIFDIWLAAVGAQFRHNAMTAIDHHIFSGSCLSARDLTQTG